MPNRVWRPSRASPPAPPGVPVRGLLSNPHLHHELSWIYSKLCQRLDVLLLIALLARFVL